MNSKISSSFPRAALAGLMLMATPLLPLASQAQVADPAVISAAPVKAAAKRPAQLRFATPEAAAEALYAAVQAGDEARVVAIMGRGAGKVIDSGDAHEDLLNRAISMSAYQRGHVIEFEGTRRATLLLGETNWPFPFPLVQEKSQWRFDTKAGLRQFLDRQIGANELNVMPVMLAYVQAQQEYVRRDRTHNGLLEYAQRMVSSEGQHDGLYWPPEEGKALSPMGARFALASLGRWRGTDDEPEPLHGYYFRPLQSQGPNAKGGAYDYLVGEHQIGGFALLATPARYGVSGVLSFIVNHDGVVYSKNLGRETTAIAEQINSYDPDKSWKREMPEQFSGR
ncbi:DUF2950 domain-containing protein [Roseateles oligotrophus]|uniref:DUF2950 domain-containing protein n=1 Tax=Roseateles oligotrophus TaxID=1769250 RepID=A0ABT2YM37_9BURK|nr:DUF2950 domain-containing protein [Roseateles oligotrophus]MCV2371067.1 DUF2950 domain-containing protein [Roseateles oligotrophus]